LSYPHGNEMKGYGSCMLILTTYDFHQSRFYPKIHQQLEISL
jgi:hypothetical protein